MLNSRGRGSPEGFRRGRVRSSARPWRPVGLRHAAGGRHGPTGQVQTRPAARGHGEVLPAIAEGWLPVRLECCARAAWISTRSPLCSALAVAGQQTAPDLKAEATVNRLQLEASIARPPEAGRCVPKSTWCVNGWRPRPAPVVEMVAGLKINYGRSASTCAALRLLGPPARPRRGQDADQLMKGPVGSPAVMFSATEWRRCAGGPRAVRPLLDDHLVLGLQ